jgi:hypothetical protein
MKLKSLVVAATSISTNVFIQTASSVEGVWKGISHLLEFINSLFFGETQCQI